MPTCTVVAAVGQLSSEQKRANAEKVTRSRNEVTGAPAFFARVLFVDIADGNWFVGAAALGSNQIYIQGYIRGGRCVETKRALIPGIRDALASGAGLPTSRVWSYVVRLPPAHMVEYGHVLPEPGAEAVWSGGLPREDRAMIESFGSGQPLERAAN